MGGIWARYRSVIHTIQRIHKYGNIWTFELYTLI